MTLHFTPTQLKNALRKGCLSSKQRLYVVDVLQQSDVSEKLAEQVRNLRRYKKDPLSQILLAAVLMGFEAGIKLTNEGGCSA